MAEGEGERAGKGEVEELRNKLIDARDGSRPHLPPLHPPEKPTEAGEGGGRRKYRLKNEIGACSTLVSSVQLAIYVALLSLILFTLENLPLHVLYGLN